jgi:hypothetical protein
LIGGACSVAVVVLAASGILIARTKSGAPEEIEVVQDFEVVDFDEVSTFSFGEEVTSDEITVTEEFVEIAPAELDMHFFEDLAAGKYDDALDATIVYFETETTGNPEDDIVLNGIFEDSLHQLFSTGTAIAKGFTDYSLEVAKGYKDLRAKNATANEYVDYSLEVAQNYATAGIEVANILPSLVTPVTNVIKGIASLFA